MDEEVLDLVQTDEEVVVDEVLLVDEAVEVLLDLDDEGHLRHHQCVRMSIRHP
jgi:hypothetical protein